MTVRPVAWTWPKQPQRDGAVGLDDQVAIDFRIGERFDANLVAHVEAVGRRGFVPRQAVGHVELVVNAKAIFGHVRQAVVADVFALGIRLPGHLALKLRSRPAAVAGVAIDRPDVIRRGRTERLAEGERRGMKDEG